MQIPPAERLGQLADAQAVLKSALTTVTDEKFKTTVADNLSGRGDFQKKVAETLNDEAFRVNIVKALNDEAFRANISGVLFAKYSDQLRGSAGPTGPAGPAGSTGANGTSPTPDAVAQSINDVTFRTNLAKILADQYSNQIRGPAGPTGPAGPAGPTGKDGSNGSSPTATSVAILMNDAAFRANVARILADQYGNQLRGPAGATGPAGPAGPVGPTGTAGKDGKDGMNGTSPDPASVAQSINDAVFRADLAKVLADQYSTQLRGPAGPSGPVGSVGPAGPVGKDGRDGTSPSAASVAQLINDAAFQSDIAKIVVDQYGTQLRGPAGPTGPAGPIGPAGKDGRDGMSASRPRPVQRRHYP
jgi:hypothetical protein